MLCHKSNLKVNMHKFEDVKDCGLRYSKFLFQSNDEKLKDTRGT